MKPIKSLIYGMIVTVMSAHGVFSQKVNDSRMERDVEVAENILGTLIRQQFEQQRMFFPLEIRGNYQPGYGVSLRLPADYTTPIAFTLKGNMDNVVYENNQNSLSYNVGTGKYTRAEQQPEEEQRATNKAYTLKDKNRAAETVRRRLDMDSVKNVYNLKVIEAAMSFIVDYGDLLSQLPANERIVVTNLGDQPKVWMANPYFGELKRTHLAIEGIKADVSAFKVGKITREQAFAKIKVTNTDVVDTIAPDMELLSSIFNRLYRVDLSKTYFTEENIYYERLKDFGAVFYMQMVSTDMIDYNLFNLPTLGLQNVDMETRNKKITEVYPQFEKELKANMLEYGRTLKSLVVDESLVFNVTLTRCDGCGIPSSLELSVKGSVLKDFSSGKLSESAALNKFSIKKGASQ